MELSIDKYINENKIGTLNKIIIVLGIIIYEILYCNSLWIQQSSTYKFSLFRMIIYSILIIIILKDNKDMSEILITFQSKRRKQIAGIIFLSGFIIFFGVIIAALIIGWIPSLPIILLTILSVQYFTINITKDYAKNTVITILCFGFICAIGNPFNHVIDEKKHFLSAYNIAIANFDYNNPIIHKEIQFMDKSIKVSEFSKYFQIKYEDNFIEDYKETDITNTPAGYSQVTYIPAAIGVFVARIFNASIADLYIAGRITNCIAYAILMYITLKLLPFKNRLMYVIATMPTIICLSASYSLDAIAMGVVSIFIAYCLKLYKQEEVYPKQVIILIVILSAILQIKRMGYIVVAMILLILPIRKIFKENKQIIILGIVVMLAIQIGMEIGQRTVLSGLQSDSRVEGTNILSQIEFIVNNPLHFIKTILGSMFNYLTNYNVLYRIHERVFFTNSNTYIMFLFILIYTIYVSIVDNQKNLNVKEKVIFSTIFILQILLILVILYITYTSVGANKIEGYHPRYLFPILILLFSCFSNKNIAVKDEENTTEISTSIVMGIFMTISLAGMMTMI